MFRKCSRVGYSSACRHLAMLWPTARDWDLLDWCVSYSIAIPQALVASRPLSGADSWLTWEVSDIPSPSFYTDHTAHVVFCAAPHHIESAKSVIGFHQMER
jgi:hypothetical protein